MELAEGLRASLQEFLIGATIEIRENGSRIRTSSPLSWEVRGAQSNIQQHVSRVDVALDPQHVYEQVFVQTAGQHGILDLLCVTRAGRLVILELKTSEDLDLPMQAADYWSRICRHQEAGDLVRYGYFPGIQLQSVPKLVYLIAPALPFHLNGRAFEIPEAGNESDSHRTSRELAPRLARYDAPVSRAPGSLTTMASCLSSVSR